MAYFYLMGNASHSQMFGCVIKTRNKTIVFDGGTVNDCDQMISFLEQNANSHVDAWFFTHPHHDHIGCFSGLRANAPHVKVDRIYHHFPDLDEHVYACQSRTKLEAELWQDVKQWDSTAPVHQVLAGESFCFDDVNIRVLRVHNPSIVGINDTSVVYRIEGEKSSILILGDLSVQGGLDTMERCPLDLLETDYTQMAHHGQGGVSREFYEYIQPKRCIWASPEWLWNNDRGNGFDSDIYATVRTREWMAALGVTEHYVEKDGIQCFEF